MQAIFLLQPCYTGTIFGRFRAPPGATVCDVQLFDSETVRAEIGLHGIL